ncbi:Syntaxin-17 [Sarcoptes scabiei]|uniref:Syntaxin-17 n=1 Tax=Sarcoptes scabiei TaxID=52283 RepID=A0A131ZSG9_SARSC|nr:Syntaxin-17 [Sarcoptes scabiei]KPL93587.1 syntaxin-17-like protein [Sarcoptes scabiei]
MDHKRRRQLTMIKDKTIEIIELGIKPNLLRLDRISKLIKQNDSTSFGEDPKVMRECLQSRSIIQQLLNNSSELEKCFILLKELDAEQELIDRVLIMKTKVSENVKCFMQSNGEFDSKINKQIRNQSEGNFKDISDSDQILIQKDQNDLQNVQRTYEEILSINRDLQELNDLMVHFGELVHEQKEAVNNIEENIETASQNVQKGTKVLAKVASRSVVPIACAAVGASIFGPIGALITLKLSAGLASALGGSVVSYSLASYVKNKNQKKTEIELDDILNANEAVH